MREKRKYSILIAFIVAAIITPPDVISQVLLASVLICLYEVSIYSVQIIEKKREKINDYGGDLKSDVSQEN